MIPKSSQRGGGRDLATHLLNAFDNEFVELADVRGAVAHDLHGAFAEWEAIGSALTRSRNYLYSLSINPDHRQGALTREQYADYADRVEKALGLSGQPRAMVFHIKDGREHCHVVWSRIDAQAGKAIHMAFDHQKLMMVTREFAREHGLRLPSGYERNAQVQEQNKARQLSLYEKEQQRQTGISKEQRIAEVTAIWQRSDTAKAFVRALEECGYVLAAGDKRPYVLVDMYGTMNALPKLIGDRSVRTKDIRAFLENDFPPEALPTVEEARALVAQHRQALEDFAKAQRDRAPLEALEKAQAVRREKAVAERAALEARQKRERAHVEAEQLRERQALKRAYLTEVRRIKEARLAARPTGLAAFLGRVTGVSLVIRKIHQHRDAQRFAAYVGAREGLKGQQGRIKAELEARHRLQALDADRALRALDQVDARERKSLETQATRVARVKQREGSERMPALTLELKPGGRRAVPHKAMYRYRKKDTAKAELSLEALEGERAAPDAETLKEKFARAAEGKGEAQGGRGASSTGGPVKARTGRGQRAEEGIEVDISMNPPETIVPPQSSAATGVPDPHWTELPLSETFRATAREQDPERGDSDTRRIRPSRSSRRRERGQDKGRDKGRDKGDFERDR